MTRLIGRHGEFLNGREGEGYEWRKVRVNRRLWFLPRVIWEFSLIDAHPLVWCEYDGEFKGYWRAPSPFETDGGSEPNFARPILSESQFPCSYSNHDAAWTKHKFRFMPDQSWMSDPEVPGQTGLMWSATAEGPYTFRPLTKTQGNVLFGHWLDAEGAKNWERLTILFFVGIGKLWH